MSGEKKKKKKSRAGVGASSQGARRSKKSHQKGVHYLAQQEGVESGEKVYPTIPRKFERLRDVIFHSIWGSFAIGLVLLGSVPSPGPNNRPMQTLILLLGLGTQQQGTKEKQKVPTTNIRIVTIAATITSK